MGMAHHIGTEATGYDWTRMSNNMIHRLCNLLPNNFVGVGQLPQHPGVYPKKSIPELERMVKELGFVGVNLNPDPSGGYWTGPPLTDRSWYPLYEKMVELVHEAGIDAKVGQLEDAKFADGEFDVVTLWGVLEHVQSPTGTIQEISRITGDQGLLVIYTQNASAPEARWLGLAGAEPGGSPLRWVARCDIATAQ